MYEMSASLGNDFTKRAKIDGLRLSEEEWKRVGHFVHLLEVRNDCPGLILSAHLCFRQLRDASKPFPLTQDPHSSTQFQPSSGSMYLGMVHWRRISTHHFTRPYVLPPRR